MRANVLHTLEVGELDAGEVLTEDGLLIEVGGGLTNNGVGGHRMRLAAVEYVCLLCWREMKTTTKA